MTATKPLLEPRRRPVQRRSRATVEDILTAAAQVFETHGYSAGTTNRIARRAGVSIGTLYQYFPSKEAVAVALLERHVSETQRGVEEWIAHMLAERHGLAAALADYVAAMLRSHADRPRLLHILLEETPLPERVHGALLLAGRRAAKAVAGLLRTYREVRHPHPERAGALLVETVEALTHRFAAHPGQHPVSREEFAAELVSMLTAYLASRSVRPGRRQP